MLYSVRQFLQSTLIVVLLLQLFVVGQVFKKKMYCNCVKSTMMTAKMTLKRAEFVLKTVNTPGLDLEGFSFFAAYIQCVISFVLCQPRTLGKTDLTKKQKPHARKMLACFFLELN